MNTKYFPLTVIATLALTIAASPAKTPDRFEQADANHDKSLSLDELNNYLVSEVFESRDKNKDKRLTRAEWIVGNDSEKSFRERDANGDDVVTMEEALAFGRKKGLAKQFLHDADSNKDGKLTSAEVKAYYASKEGPTR